MPRLINITFDDIANEVSLWKSSVVCFVLGANPPLHIIEGYACRIWKDLGIDKIGMVAKGVFLVRFKVMEECRRRALRMVSCLIKNHLL